MTVGHILTLIGLFIALTAHIVATVWWASAVNTTLKIVVKDVGDLVTELKAMKHLYVQKEDHAKDMAIAEKERQAMWRKIDLITTGGKNG